MSAGAITLADIASADWSLMLDSTAAALGLPTGVGNVVQGINDVVQCVAIILTTPPGADPLRPTFGCDLFQYIDQPINRALPAIVAAVTAAIEQWEPRITVLGITAQPGAIGQLIVAVSWQLNIEGAGPQTTEVTIGQIAANEANG